MGNSILLEQIFYLAILILVGVVASKIGVIKANTQEGLIKIIFNITLPALLLTNFSTLELTSRILTDSLIVIAISSGSILMMLVVGYAFSKLFDQTYARRSVMIVHHSFGNILYLGFPVVLSLFGEIGLFYASIYAFVSITMLWTLGVYILSRHERMSITTSLKKMLNPNLIALVAGFVLFVTEIKIPSFILNPLKGLGGTTTYLSMVYIGSVLGLMKVKGIFSNKMVFLTTFSKNLLLPIILILLFYLAGDSLFSSVDRLILSVIVIEAAMPCMANIVVISKMFGADDSIAASNVFLSTLVSMVTLPAIYYLLSRIIL